MKRKKWIVPACIIAGVVILCIAAVWVTAGIISEKGFSVMKGKLYIDGTQVYLIEQTGGAVCLSDRTKGKDLFQNSVSGDTVLVLHDWMLETYPAQTGAYWIQCLERGDGSYRPDDDVLGRVDVDRYDRAAHLLETMTDYAFKAHYIRTGGYNESVHYPQVSIIRSLEQLQNYCLENRQLYQFERGADGGESFLDACDRYDDAYFEKQCLVLVLVQEGSGSVRHEVDRVGTADGETVINIKRLVPEVGTCDMALWHILIEPEAAMEIKEDNPIAVLLDGSSTTNPARTVSCKTENGMITLELPAGWASTVMDTVDDFSVAIWPEAYADGKICIKYFSSGFGVCGTGLSTEPIQLGAYTGSQGTYDNGKLWSFISFPATHGNYAILNEGAQTWWDTHGREAMRILETLTMGK